MVSLAVLVAVLVAFTVAFGTVAPLGSVTIPVNVARSCAYSPIGSKRSASTLRALMLTSLLTLYSGPLDLVCSNELHRLAAVSLHWLAPRPPTRCRHSVPRRSVKPARGDPLCSSIAPENSHPSASSPAAKTPACEIHPGPRRAWPAESPC